MDQHTDQCTLHLLVMKTNPFSRIGRNPKRLTHLIPRWKASSAQTHLLPFHTKRSTPGSRRPELLMAGTYDFGVIDFGKDCLRQHYQPRYHSVRLAGFCHCRSWHCSPPGRQPGIEYSRHHFRLRQQYASQKWVNRLYYSTTTGGQKSDDGVHFERCSWTTLIWVTYGLPCLARRGYPAALVVPYRHNVCLLGG